MLSFLIFIPNTDRLKPTEFPRVTSLLYSMDVALRVGSHINIEKFGVLKLIFSLQCPNVVTVVLPALQKQACLISKIQKTN